MLFALVVYPYFSPKFKQIPFTDCQIVNFLEITIFIPYLNIKFVMF